MIKLITGVIFIAISALLSIYIPTNEIATIAESTAAIQNSVAMSSGVILMVMGLDDVGGT